MNTGRVNRSGVSRTGYRGAALRLYTTCPKPALIAGRTHRDARKLGNGGSASWSATRKFHRPVAQDKHVVRTPDRGQDLRVEQQCRDVRKKAFEAALRDMLEHYKGRDSSCRTSSVGPTPRTASTCALVTEARWHRSSSATCCAAGHGRTRRISNRNSRSSTCRPVQGFRILPNGTTASRKTVIRPHPGGYSNPTTRRVILTAGRNYAPAEKQEIGVHRC